MQTSQNRQKLTWIVAILVFLVVIIIITMNGAKVTIAPTISDNCDTTCQYLKQYGHLPANGKE